MSAENVCILCRKLLEGSGPVANLGKKGIKSISEASLKRDDGLKLEIESKNQIENIAVHTKCRKTYTDDRMIKALIKRKKVLNTKQIDNFNFTLNCLLCGNIAINHQDVRNIKMAHTKNTIMAIATRNKPSGETILKRIQDVDLVAVGAKYHITCYTTFRNMSHSTDELIRKRGRPEDDNTNIAMETIYRHIKENYDECQFTLADLKKCLNDNCPDDRTIIKKIQEKYGDKLNIVKQEGKPSIFCFRNTSGKILQEAWQAAKSNNDEDQKLTIIRTAASILLDDIRSTPYDLSQYPPPNDFLKGSEDVIPKSLLIFLEEIIMKNKKDEETASRKCQAIGHAIVSAVRPRSFISPVLLGLGALIHQKYAAKSLIDLLSSIGFCASYHEISLFIISSVAHSTPEDNGSSFCQYVFDNADHNVKTIDGHHTFHSMGGIKCYTPKLNDKNEGIIRQNKIPSSFVVGNFGNVPLENYGKYKNKGLKQISIPNYAADEDISKISIPWTDITWCFAKKEEFDIPGWNGYMERLNSFQKFDVSEIVPFPFVNNPPSEYETIYTAILLAVDNSKRNDIKTTIVTFDQPLYHKAKDITTSSEDPRLKSVLVRLGGFHLLMSYMGAIGYIMNGSGLKELWSTIYAPSSIEKMLSGHSYSRAIRAHTLTHLSLGKIILQNTKYDDEDVATIENVIFNGIENGTKSLDAIIEKFEETLEILTSHGPTAKLWIMYFRMVTLAKQFIEAERSGNWNLHISTIKKMLPFFHSTGHFAYAKSATMYLQDMYNIKNVLTTEELEKFTTKGYFTIRRTNKFWAGIWSDMTIEQTLMRSMKSSGGLTHGRGISDAVLAKWLLASPILCSVITSLENFAGVMSASSEQHVDSRSSRIKRDLEDVAKIDTWFQTYNPYPILDKIMCLNSGMIGDININCHQADTVGLNMMLKQEGQNFEDVKYSRKDRVLPLAAINSSIKVEDTRIAIEPEMLFRRIAFAKKDQNELKEYFKYELAPFPLPLFDINGMRKCKKSSFYDLFKPENESTISETNKLYVIDGGYLLHKVIWPKGATFYASCEQYVKYIKNNYGTNTVVVFDGYPDEVQDKGTKSTERLRREKQHRTHCNDILFSEKTLITVRQEIFLSNSKNKQRFITLLKRVLEENSIQTHQAEEDADTLIVKTALENTEKYNAVIITGEDIDLLVILCGCPDSRKSKVSLLKPGKNKVPSKIYSSHSFSPKELADHVLFIHAFSGCDTTSALFRQGKKKLVEVMKKNIMLQDYSLVFKDRNADKKSIIEAGEKIMTSLYSKHLSGKTLNDLRYEIFARSVTKSKFNLASLPPTTGATAQHSLRTYLQIQCWLGEKKEPINWGWKFENSYQPVQTLNDPAPPEILSMISCKCKIACRHNCTCKKAALNCSVICYDCQGKPCTGSIAEDEHDETDETELEKNLTLYSNSGQPSDDNMEDNELELSESSSLVFDVTASDDTDKENVDKPSCSKRSRL